MILSSPRPSLCLGRHWLGVGADLPREATVRARDRDGSRGLGMLIMTFSWALAAKASRLTEAEAEEISKRAETTKEPRRSVCEHKKAYPVTSE